MSIRHGHSSSRYDKPPKTLAEQVGRATTSGKDANLLTFTEVDTKDRAAKLQADGWGSYAPFKEADTDCALMWDKAEFEKLAAFTSRLGNSTWHMDGGHDQKIVCATMVLKHLPSGNKLWVSVLHLPSQVQEGDRFSNDQTDQDRVKCWKQGVDAWREKRKDAEANHHQDVSMHVSDWNVDFRSKHWRDEVDGRIGADKFRGTWTADNLPNDGTHENRLIDATWTNGKFKDTMLLPDDDSSDHRPCGEVIGW
jgi:hypothetical protein